jgi:hypothetical protein
LERREKEDDTLKKLDGKIDKYERKAKEVQAAIDAGDDSPQLLVDLRDAQSSAERYRVKKEHFVATRKLIADDLCEVKEDHTTIAPVEPKPTLPEKPVDEAESYDAYVKTNKAMLMEYSQITDDTVAQEFILKHTHILDAHAEGFLLLLCLDSCMRHKAEPVPLSADKAKAFDDEEFRIAKQHLVIHYLLELAKGMKREPIEAVVPFFRKVCSLRDALVERVVCMYVCMYACMYVYMYVCMYVCMLVSDVRIAVFTQTLLVAVCVCVRPCVCVCAGIQALSRGGGRFR